MATNFASRDEEQDFEPLGDEEAANFEPIEPAIPARPDGTTVIPPSAAVAESTRVAPPPGAPVAPAAPAAPQQPSLLGDAAGRIGGQVAAFAKDPVGSVGQMIVGTVKDASQAAAVPTRAIATLMKASPTAVLQRLPVPDTQRLRDKGWDEARIQHVLDQHEKVSNSLMADIDDVTEKITEDTASGVALYLSLLAGFGAGKAVMKPIASKLVRHMIAGSAGLGTFGAAKAAGMGEGPREIATEGLAGIGMGALMGAAARGAGKGIEAARKAPAIAAAGEALGHGVVDPLGLPADMAPLWQKAIREAATPEARAELLAKYEVLQRGSTGPEGVGARQATAPEVLSGMEQAMLRSATPAERAAFLEAKKVATAPKARPPAEGLAKAEAPAVELDPVKQLEARAANPVVVRVRDLLKKAAPLMKDQKALNKDQHSARIAAALAARKAAGGGVAGHRAALSKLKGAFPKAEFEGILEQLSDAEKDVLQNLIEEAPLTPYEHIRAGEALNKLLGVKTEGGVIGGVPNASEMKLLSQVFGKDFVQVASSKRTKWGKFGQEAAGVINIPRALMTSFDLSAPGRQGFLLSTTSQFWKNLGPMVRAFGDEKFFNAGTKEMSMRPEFKQFKQAGGAFTDIHGQLGPYEEAFATRLVEKIPGVKQSARAHSFFLNRLRMDTYRKLMQSGEKAGIDVTKDLKFRKDAAAYVNQATGRANLPKKFEGAANLLNTYFFSPRLLASRLKTMQQLVDVANIEGVNPLVRKQMLQNTIGAAAGAMSVATLLSQIPGVSVGLDPFSSDFGKVRAGNTRYDLFGGHLQVIRFLAQFGGGKVVTSTGRVRRVGDDEDRHPLTRWDIFTKFLETKESPVASLVHTLYRGTDWQGQPIKVREEMAKRVIPLLVQDTYEAIVEKGAAGALDAVPAAVGIGVQTYGSPVTRQGGPVDTLKEGLGTFGLPTIEFRDKSGKTRRAFIPREHADAFVKEMQDAEVKALVELVPDPSFMALSPAKAEALIKSTVEAYRTEVRERWITANEAALTEGASGGQSVMMKPPVSEEEADFEPITEVPR